eukprot:scaffold30310_cov50-Cyclotella_meneghiniana.AAC.1
MDLQLRSFYIGISRTKRALAHGGRLLSKIHQLYDNTLTTSSTLSPRTQPIYTAFQPIDHLPSKSRLKTTVENLFITDSEFANWLLHLVSISSTSIMPHQNVDSSMEDFPSLAEASKMQESKQSKRHKTGPFGDAKAVQNNTAVINNQAASPIRPSGSKRPMIKSPTRSPTRINEDIQDINMGGDDDVLDQRSLEQKLVDLAYKGTLSLEDVREITLDESWIGDEFVAKDAGLESALKQPTVPGGYEYEFTDSPSAPLTSEIIQTVNIDKIIKICAQRAEKKTNPATSAYHPSNGPFGLAPRKTNVDVVTKDGKVAGSFSTKTYGLNTAPEFLFETKAPATYEILCRAYLPKLHKKLRALQKGSKLFQFLLDKDNGPIMLNPSESNDRILVHTPIGMIATIYLSDAVGKSAGNVNRTEADCSE